MRIAESLRVLLAGLIDYAGLFPPAGLNMDAAVREYAAHRSGPHAWALGRFVVPVARLAEFQRAAGREDQAWRLSVLAGPDLSADIRKISNSNMEAIELKASTPEEISAAANIIAASLPAYFEIPIHDDPGPLLAAIAQARARAKVRTGGITPEAFPHTGDLARFLSACHRANVAFKATAGLHHPVRSTHPLTCEPNSPSHRMHGFLNVFLTAAFIRAGMGPDEAAELLEETSPEALRFANDGASWRVHRLNNDALAEARRELAISFGSCSFAEPISDLKKLGLF